MAEEKDAYVCTQWLFLRALGLIYFLAFVSLGLEIHGLLGSRGILPVSTYLTSLTDSLPPDMAVAIAPSLVWFNSSDGFLSFLCWGGALAGLGMFLSIATAPLLVVAWLFYLSLVNVGQDFLSFQWDILLLETGFLAIFWSPWQLLGPPWKGKLILEPQPWTFKVGLYLLRWLLFRLMFLSGTCKLLSGDETWRNFTALKFHYLTQPLPTPLAWLADQMPNWFQSFSVGAVFFIEIMVPVLFFMPRRLRLAGAALTALLQVVILLTGNYTFFNLLTLALCIPLLDDRALKSVLPARLRELIIGGQVAQSPSSAKLGTAKLAVRRAAVSLLAVMVGMATLSQMSLLPVENLRSLPIAVRRLFFAAQSLHIVNSYGLFAVMTTRRLEIQVEGSNDGVTWLPYVFKYKPGPLDRPPPIVAPLQPRLDWQMWFAALGTVDENPWFFKFAERLLQASPDVVHLLETDPFYGKPPKLLRAELYEYKFSSFAELWNGGIWWKRTPAGSYMQPVSLSNFAK